MSHYPDHLSCLQPHCLNLHKYTPYSDTLRYNRNLLWFLSQTVDQWEVIWYSCAEIDHTIWHHQFDKQPTLSLVSLFLQQMKHTQEDKILTIAVYKQTSILIIMIAWAPLQLALWEPNDDHIVNLCILQYVSFVKIVVKVRTVNWSCSCLFLRVEVFLGHCCLFNSPDIL